MNELTKARLKQFADEMLAAVDTLCVDEGVDLLDPAVVHLATGNTPLLAGLDTGFKPAKPMPDKKVYVC
jgi:hypothetical protein